MEEANPAFAHAFRRPVANILIVICSAEGLTVSSIVGVARGSRLSVPLPARVCVFCTLPHRVQPAHTAESRRARISDRHRHEPALSPSLFSALTERITIFYTTCPTINCRRSAPPALADASSTPYSGVKACCIAPLAPDLSDEARRRRPPPARPVTNHATANDDLLLHKHAHPLPAPESPQRTRAADPML